VRVLIFHGYLLRGTGSNVYNAALAQALVRLGHEVHLVCQERHADDLEFVGAVGDWDSGQLTVRQIRDVPCTVYRPDIGGLLPVYVADRYEGLDARPFQELTDGQLDHYLEANVAAVSEVASRSDCDVALANHLVMGPVIVARALEGTSVPYAVKIHGSALEYTVKRHARFLPYALEGLASARGVLVGSRHDAENLWSVLEEAWLPARTRLGPPGVDIHRFRPRERRAALARLRALGERVAEQAWDAEAESSAAASSFGRDRAATASALGRLTDAGQAGPLVTFVGKLIVSKGIDLLLAAWPLVLDAVPEARLAVVGFGAYRGAVERMIEALAAGDLAAVRELAAVGRAAEDGPRTRLRLLDGFLDWLESSGQRERYLTAARRLPERLVLTGRLEHEELADVLPLCAAIVVPSTFPESFGMVVVEAAACGALPISAAHSGLSEVTRTLAEGLPEPARELLSFALEPDVVQSIAARVTTWLRSERQLREATRAALVATTAERYSWERVAQEVIAAARGELAALEPPTVAD
jgi:glycosyltransferase involved in cell wall biosynthesis